MSLRTCTITMHILAAGRVPDIPVRDHVVISGSRCVSFAETG